MNTSKCQYATLANLNCGQYLTLCLSSSATVEESDIIDLEKRYWLLKAQSRTGRFDLETFVPLVSPPIHASLSEGKTLFIKVHCSEEHFSY